MWGHRQMLNKPVCKVLIQWSFLEVCVCVCVCVCISPFFSPWRYLLPLPEHSLFPWLSTLHVFLSFNPLAVLCLFCLFLPLPTLLLVSFLCFCSWHPSPSELIHFSYLQMPSIPLELSIKAPWGMIMEKWSKNTLVEHHPWFGHHRKTGQNYMCYCCSPISCALDLNEMNRSYKRNLFIGLRWDEHFSFDQSHMVDIAL